MTLNRNKEVIYLLPAFSIAGSFLIGRMITLKKAKAALQINIFS